MIFLTRLCDNYINVTPKDQENGICIPLAFSLMHSTYVAVHSWSSSPSLSFLKTERQVKPTFLTCPTRPHGYRRTRRQGDRFLPHISVDWINYEKISVAGFICGRWTAQGKKVMGGEVFFLDEVKSCRFWDRKQSWRYVNRICCLIYLPFIVLRESDTKFHSIINISDCVQKVPISCRVSQKRCPPLV